MKFKQRVEAKYNIVTIEAGIKESLNKALKAFTASIISFGLSTPGKADILKNPQQFTKPLEQLAQNMAEVLGEDGVIKVKLVDNQTRKKQKANWIFLNRWPFGQKKRAPAMPRPSSLDASELALSATATGAAATQESPKPTHDKSPDKTARAEQLTEHIP